MCHVKPAEVKDDGYKYSGPLRPAPYSFQGKRQVPAHIKKPDYATTGRPNMAFQALADKVPPIYTDDEDIALLRAASLMGRKALDEGHRVAQVGVTTEEIDRVVHEFLIDNDAYPSPLNYYNFPRSCCTSVNEVICHGIPDTRPLKDGDILNLDVTAYVNGYHGDLNETYCIGNVHESSLKLIKATYESLQKSMDICKPGTMYRECGNAIAKHCEPLGYSVVKSYTGHGIGKIFHQAP
jgi:methionyl aminopeptidase